MKKTIRLILAVAMGLGGMGLLMLVQSTAAQSSEATQKLEQRIKREVRHELAMLPQYDIFDNLAYKVDGSTVTLLGQVHDAFLKDAAEATVKHIEGVEHINNQIEVLPVSQNDDRIRREVARAIFNDPRLNIYAIQSVPPIHVIVKNGHVTLEGVVRNQTDKDAAGIRANGVPGVFSVQNNLQVESGK